MDTLSSEELQQRKRAAYKTSDEVFGDSPTAIVDLEKNFLEYIKKYNMDPSVSKLLWCGRARMEWIQKLGWEERCQMDRFCHVGKSICVHLQDIS